MVDWSITVQQHLIELLDASVDDIPSEAYDVMRSRTKQRLWWLIYARNIIDAEAMCMATDSEIPAFHEFLWREYEGLISQLITAGTEAMNGTATQRMMLEMLCDPEAQLVRGTCSILAVCLKQSSDEGWSNNKYTIATIWPGETWPHPGTPLLEGQTSPWWQDGTDPDFLLAAEHHTWRWLRTQIPKPKKGKRGKPSKKKGGQRKCKGTPKDQGRARQSPRAQNAGTEGSKQALATNSPPESQDDEDVPEPRPQVPKCSKPAPATNTPPESQSDGERPEPSLRGKRGRKLNGATKSPPESLR
ncbi:hypothetical protein FIBSPDRAFT_947801 [Athelia psychrophila]|uniref:Uncharacterized protein n=1 Tax=Athelia psychrophila TaxID=1759441 RepID=A0A166RFN2_9AGAM|nr:hypothetical protein FIBSPDRAFT_947801 [Fibularhizoctonia sp. CBS 109695]